MSILSVLVPMASAFVGGALAYLGGVAQKGRNDRAAARAAARVIAVEMHANYGQLRAARDCGNLNRTSADQEDVDLLRPWLHADSWGSHGFAFAKGATQQDYGAIADAYVAMGRLHACGDRPVWLQVDEYMEVYEAALRTLDRCAHVSDASPVSASNLIAYYDEKREALP